MSTIEVHGWISAFSLLILSSQSVLAAGGTDEHQPRGAYMASQCKDGRSSLLGDDTEILGKVMTDYLNPDSAFARSLANPDVALPIPVSSK